ncbi:hypothetical protein PT069_09405 [Erysipelothrix rhusiopathiae]|nr:hypothetical protein [Erysipelothrix rhusiopathiae]
MELKLQPKQSQHKGNRIVGTLLLVLSNILPLFISEGEVVLVNTTDGKYSGRA